MIYLFLVVILWSFIPLLSTLFKNELDINNFIFFSNLISTLSILPFVKFKKLKYQLSTKSLFNAFVLSILGIFGYYLLIYKAYSLTSKANDILIIQYLWPLFTTIFAVIILKEHLNIKKILALIFGIVSAIIVITKGNFTFDISITLAKFYAFVASISFALYSVLSKKISPKHKANGIFLYFFIATILSMIFFYNKIDFTLNFSNEAWIMLVINGVFINGISYLFWIWALQKVDVSFASSFILLVPILSTLEIIIILHQDFQAYMAIALIFAIFSGYLANLKSDKLLS